IETLLAWRRAWLGMDKNPKALLFVQSRTGASLLHLAFLGILTRCWLDFAQLAVAAAGLAACFLFPAKRIQAVSIVGILSLLAQPFRGEAFERHASGWLAQAAGTGIDPHLYIAAIA